MNNGQVDWLVFVYNQLPPAQDPQLVILHHLQRVPNPLEQARFLATSHNLPTLEPLYTIHCLPPPRRDIPSSIAPRLGYEVCDRYVSGKSVQIAALNLVV